MPLDTSCPSVELLRRSLDPGDPMPDSERQQIEAHVGRCEGECKAVIEALLRGSTPPAGPLSTRYGLLDAGPAGAEAPSARSTETPGPPHAGEPLPERLGRYQVLGRLGAGGMGVVYRAHDPHLHRDVAIKLPSFQGTEDASGTRQRFLREARAAAAVRHPNVCPIYDVGEEQGRPYVVMALIEGESLADRLRRQGRVEDTGEAVALVVQVADALAAVHAAAIVHRDLR
jgi:hypothetical protein